MNMVAALEWPESVAMCAMFACMAVVGWAYMRYVVGR